MQQQIWVINAVNQLANSIRTFLFGYLPMDSIILMNYFATMKALPSRKYYFMKLVKKYFEKGNKIVKFVKKI